MRFTIAVIFLQYGILNVSRTAFKLPSKATSFWNSNELMLIPPFLMVHAA